MSKLLKKETKMFLFLFVLLLVIYAFLFILNITKPSITGLVVYNLELKYENYTFENSSLYTFNDSLINLTNGIRLIGTYNYYNITNEANETITLSNITYPYSAVIDTLDFSPSNLNRFDSLTRNELLNNQNITYYYSTDSGNNWTLMQDFNLSNINSTKIRFRINLISNTTETPIVNYLTLFYLESMACIENWQCTEWSTCYLNNTQIRTCTDSNACGSEDNKPALTQSCTYSCLSTWLVLYENCLVNNTKLKYYNDTTNCNNLTNLPVDNGTYVGCDYCITNWTCSLYGNCTDDEKNCLVVNDVNNCYNITNLSSDNYTGDYSEFITSCNATTESSESSSEESSSEAPASAGEESAEAQLAISKSECNYDVSIDIPDQISFIEKNNLKANIQNKGCKIDKLSLSLSPELINIIKLSNYEILNLEKDNTADLNLSTNPLITRIKPNLLIQGFAAKTIQKQIRNITGNIIIKGNIGEESKIDKNIPITASVILFDKIELEKKSPMLLFIISLFTVAAIIVYLTTKFKFNFKLQ